MAKFEECYGDFFDFLFFLCFAHTDMIFVVYNDDNLKANCPADICGVSVSESDFCFGLELVVTRIFSFYGRNIFFGTFNCFGRKNKGDDT